MRIIITKDSTKRIKYEQLIDYGFTLNNNKYILERNIINDDFKVVIIIEDCIMKSKVIDNTLNDEYLLVDIEDSKGNFIGKIKEEYTNVINEILNNCTFDEVFKNIQTKQIIKYVKEKYNDDVKYLWKKFPRNGVWKNKNNKWYGAILTVKDSKIGGLTEEIIEVLDLRYQKDKINDILKDDNIYPGYHMNKNSWITIRLDNSLKIEKIYNLIDNSYEISLTK